MANTTNFGWETPDDTDLVKDGAAAMRTLGNAIDTSMVDLKGGTSGQILSKNSNTDMDFVWIANDQGDITGVTASSPLTGGGTSGAITVGIQDGTTAQKGAIQLEDSTSSTSTTKAATPNSVKSAYDLANGAIAKSLVDAKGDLIVASADNTVARLAIGSNDQVLTADSTATNGLKWATPAGSSGPAFRAYRNTSSQSLAQNTVTKVQLNGEDYDTDNCFDSSTNYRFTATKAGYYLILANIFFDNGGSGNANAVYIRKNGNTTAGSDFKMSTVYCNTIVEDLVYLNGSTDYIEIYARTNNTSGAVYYGSTDSWASGVWIRS